MLVGNKSDLNDKRVVQESEGQSFAYDNNLNFMEVSAKSSHVDCTKVFEKTAEIFYKKIIDNRVDVTRGEFGVHLGPSHPKFVQATDPYKDSANNDRLCCFF